MNDIILSDLKSIDVDISSLKNSKILITGASGLVGVYLVSFLSQFSNDLNIEIHAWTKSPIDTEFVDLYRNVVNIVGDITDSTIFSELSEYDIIIHASGYGQPTRFLQDKIKTIEINTSSTIELFKKLRDGGKFLFISTSEIYSGNDSFEIDEEQVGNTNTSHPRSCYIESKRTGESICFAYLEQGFDVKIARLCLAYGPGTKRYDQRVLNSIVQRSQTEDEIRLMDSGSAIRTYCYITDVVEMFLNILISGKENIYNVGGVSSLSILDLAKTIGEMTGKTVSTPIDENSLSGNPKVVNISIDRYCKEFNKLNFVELDKGLLKTIAWQKKLYTDGK
jgi:UDP-glucuronate decarboxylase